MAGYYVDLEDATEENSYFRKVLFTGKHLQLVVMCLQPGEEIGLGIRMRPNATYSSRCFRGSLVTSRAKSAFPRARARLTSQTSGSSSHT